MNLYKWSTQVINNGEHSGSRPTVRLIILYRALHECSLMAAKTLVEDVYPERKGDYYRTNIEFFVDDTALGRLTYAVMSRHQSYTTPSIERMCNTVNAFNIVGVNCQC